MLAFLIAVSFQVPDEAVSKTALPVSKVFNEDGAKISPWKPNIWVDVGKKGRRVVVRAKVCLRDGILEDFMCRTRTKEHEAVVAADIDARNLHAALLIAGATPGHPARFRPKFQPPAGDKIEVWVEWTSEGKTKRVKAQQWIRNSKTGKTLEADWVFAGSQLVTNPVTKEKYYVANDGDVISIANFTSALMDISSRSSSVNSDIFLEAFTENIPKVDTEVFVILRPVPKPNKQRSSRVEEKSTD